MLYKFTFFRVLLTLCNFSFTPDIQVFNILIRLPGYDFVQVRVISFSSGSIIPSLIVTVDPSSPRSQQDVQNDLTVAIANMDNSLGDGISVEPQSANVAEGIFVFKPTCIKLFIKLENHIFSNFQRVRSKWD